MDLNIPTFPVLTSSASSVLPPALPFNSHCSSCFYAGEPTLGYEVQSSAVTGNLATSSLYRTFLSFQGWWDLSFLSVSASTHSPGTSHLPHILSLSGKPLLLAWPLFSPLCLLKWASVICSQAPWFRVDFVAFFWWLCSIPQCFGMPSPAAFWECGSRMATLCFPVLPLWVPYRTPPPLSPPPVGLNSREMVSI